jgi:phosphoribosyl-ATP pyrophosphohydrolase/phosphoribosyl-AMP cyclohydrolase
VLALVRVIAQRHRDAPEGSYTAKLFRGGVDRVAKKVGEEAVEVAIAAKNHAVQPTSELANELADLAYHVLVLGELLGLDVRQVYRALADRAKPSLPPAP